MSNNINTYPIQEFIEAVKVAELTQKKEIKLDIKTAKILALTLGEVTSKLNQDYERLISKLSSQDNSILEIRVDGGDFK